MSHKNIEVYLHQDEGHINIYIYPEKTEDSRTYLKNQIEERLKNETIRG